MKQVIVSSFIFSDIIEKYILSILNMIIGLLKTEYLSSTGLIGFWVLFLGIIFTGIMFYFVFFKLNLVDDSFKGKERRKQEKEEQKAKIEKLYPKENQSL